MTRWNHAALTSALAYFSALALAVVGVIVSNTAANPVQLPKSNFLVSPATKQLIALVIGMVLMVFLSRMPFEQLRSLARVLLVLTVVLLVVVYLPGIGVPVAGARRRIGFGIATFQPAELAKLTIILFLAAACSRQVHRIHNLAYLSSLLGIVALVLLIIEREPDLGTAVIVFLTSLAVLYLAGAKVRHLLGVMIVSVVLLFTLLHFSDRTNAGYRTERLALWRSPEGSRHDAENQVVQSLIAVSASGLGGVGPGNGESKYYLPASNTDYAMAIVAEEFGMLGVLIVLLGIGLVFLRAHYLATTSQDTFVRLVAGGIGAWIMLQSAINLAVVTNCVPATGVPMPFVSHGTSALVVTLAAVGILTEPSVSLLPVRQRRRSLVP